MNKDYYQILGLAHGASKDDIKKAFNRLAHKYHPDKKGGDEAKFKEINEAYQILSDDRKRAAYDRFGEAGAAGFGAGQGGSAPGWDFSNFTGGGDQGTGFQFDIGDLFGDLFGGDRGGKRVRRGRDISVDIQIAFSEAVFGTERSILINKVGTCEHCGGRGAEPGSKTTKCQTCNGRGRLNETRRSFLGTFTTQRECSTCRGSGEVPEKVCGECRGQGVIKKAEEVKILIPAGIEDGEMIRLANRGEAASRGVSGDLYVRVHVESHATFRRDGVNLLMDLSVNLSDALLGAEYSINTLDGKLTLKVPEGIGYGEVLRIKSHGVPTRTGKRGDLLVKIIIKIPRQLSKKARALIEGLKAEGL